MAKIFVRQPPTSCLLPILQLRHLDRCLIDKANDEEGDDADNPFKINDVGQDTDLRAELPGKEADDADQGCPESRVLAAQGRAEHGAKEDQREGRRQAQTDEHDFDDADGVEGQPQRAGADDEDDQAVGLDVACFGNIRFDKTFKNVLRDEGTGTEENRAGRRYIGRPEGSQGHP